MLLQSRNLVFVRTMIKTLLPWHITFFTVPCSVVFDFSFAVNGLYYKTRANKWMPFLLWVFLIIFFFLNKNMLRMISTNRKDWVGHNMDFPVIQCMELSLFSSTTATIWLTSLGGSDVMSTCSVYMLQRQLETQCSVRKSRSSHKVHILQTTPQLYFF